MGSLRDVKTLVYEPDRDLRSALCRLLRDTGFADILDTDRPQLVNESISGGEVDVVICNVLTVSEAMCEMIRDMRHMNLGRNPFPVAVGMTGDADQQHITKAVNAGFDGLVLKPLDLSMLRSRLHYFVNARKPFVVTSDYVGPDRRGEPRADGRPAQLMTVPNPVRMIADGVPRKTMMSHISEACAELDERKLRRDVLGVCWIADRIGRAVDTHDDHIEMDLMVHQLTTLAEDIDRRLSRTVFGHVRELCNSLVEVAARMSADGKPSRTDVELLANVAKAIRRGCDAGREDTIFAQEIAESLQARA